MFRRRWSGLPEDPDFPTDLEKLGYFINEADEIRSIANPNHYFHYFIDKNTRVNDRLRFAFTIAIDDIVHARLASLGLNRVALPLSAHNDSNKPHVPIFLTPKLSDKKRIVVIFGEPNQDLGVLAHRVVGRQGGIDEGSMVSIVKALLTSETDGDTSNGNGNGIAVEASYGDRTNDEVGIILANSGETWWWPEGKRALCQRQSTNAKMASAAHMGIAHIPSVHNIPANEDLDAHVKCVFASILENPEFVGSSSGSKEQQETGVTVQVVGIADGAVAVEKYLDANWARWAGKLGCLALIGDGMAIGEVKDEGFKRFIAEKARAYIITTEDVGTPIANSTGNPATLTFTTYGCPVLASGENYYSELTLIKAKGHVLPWMNEVYKAGESYVNPTMEVTYRDESFDATNQWPKEWIKGLKGKEGEANMKEWEKELEEMEHQGDHDESDQKIPEEHPEHKDANQEEKEKKKKEEEERAEHEQQQLQQEMGDGDITPRASDKQARCEDADDEDNDGAKAFV